MSEAIVHTPLGTLRGEHSDGVYTFLGVRYGEDTRPQRFRRAVPAQPWDGIRDALEFGAQCMQPESRDFELLRSGWDSPARSSEDCLFLNIWSPSLDDNARLPVMVNFHGGAWTAGNGNSTARSGKRFARHHGVVRVNLNHRLGIFGFSNFSALLGPDFADSGMVGMLDATMALEWIRDNISAFGGDPNNVTIFGVSGGGGKVSTLMAMPEAKGLFHRASVESGSMLTATLPERSAETTEALLDALAIPRNQPDGVLALSGEELLDGYLKMFPDGGLTASGIAPVVDGINLLHHPFEPGAPEESENIPLLVGTTTTETSIFEEFLGGSIDGLTWEDLPNRVTPFLPPEAQLSASDAISIARAAASDAGPRDILYAITSEFLIRRPALLQAERASARTAPVYMWLLAWVTPVDDGKWGSPHGLSVPLAMDTVEDNPSMFGDDLSAPLELSEKMSSAWAAFARTGKPDSPGLPAWPAYDTKERQTMVLDDECRVVSDPLADLRRLHEPR